MTRLPDLLATVLGKFVLLALRTLGRSGNALPGLVVERLFPRYLPRMLSRLPQGVVVVSGTNGKTTTTKMVSAVLAQRYQVLTNDTGSNFVRGAITAVLARATWSGRLPVDVAVFELDEAHAVRFVEVCKPDAVLLLNVMRDQLDRFGEIDTTAQLLRTVAKAAQQVVVLNHDDPRIAAIADDVTARVTYFGAGRSVRTLFPTDDELYAEQVDLGGDPADAAELPGAIAHAPLAATLTGYDGRVSTFQFGDRTAELTLHTGGAHNALNAAAAAAVALQLGVGPDDVIAGLAAVQPAFGRGQRFDYNGATIELHLVKNPAGFRQSLRALGDLTPSHVLVVINDDYADGRDVSWLWDVDFASLAELAKTSSEPIVSTSGTRAADMALRLKYDGIDVARADADAPTTVRAAADALATGETLVVFSTYTAMWSLHSLLMKFAEPAE